MSEDLDKVLELAKILEERAYEGYSKIALDYGRNPRNMGELEDFNAFAVITGPCGDTMAIWLNIEGDKIAEAGFTTDGCMTSRAAGSMTMEMAKGKTLTDALNISQQDVLDALEGLPNDNEHCALLSTNTLKNAINNYPGETCNK